jgi:hypothetical protein
MATASSARAAPATRRGGRRTGIARLVPAVATAIGVAALLRLVYGPWFLNYDARYSLLWAWDLAHGFAPEYEADFAPTPHPLQTALSVLALPFGDASDDLVVLAVLLCFGALVWLAYRLGAELFHPWVGAVAALAVLTRPALERDALLAYQDVPFAALVVLAVLMEARRPRRGAAVLAVLAAAGLLRPEGWVLSGLYLLWLTSFHRRTGSDPSLHSGARRGLTPLRVALTVAAPVIWLASDWLATGDPMHSLHGTADLAIANDRRRTVGEVPFWTAQYFGYTLREPLVVGVPIGLAFAFRYARRPALLPLAVVVAMVAVFAVGPLFGLPLIRRYIATPSVLLCLFYGLAVFGWKLLPPGRARRGWLVAGVVAALLSVAYLPWHARLLNGVDRRMNRDGVLYGDLQQAMQAAPVRAAFAACPDLTAGDHRPMPYARFWLEGEPGTVSTVEGGASPMGDLLLMPVRGPSTRRIYPPEVFPDVAVPAGWRTVYENRSWRISAAPNCARG